MSTGDDALDRVNGEWHQVYPDEFEAAEVAAHGALIGWTGGNGERWPTLTPIQREALQRALAEAFNAGAETMRA